MSEAISGDALMPRISRFHGSSLRLRMGWSFTIALSLLALGMTLVAAIDARREQVATERIHAEALLDHLAEMPAFRESSFSAQKELGGLAHYFRGAGIDVVLVPIDSREQITGTAAVAERRVNIAASPYLLRYVVRPGRLYGVLRRTAITHLLYGFAAVVITLGIAEWMLRRHVLRPIGSLESQLQHVGQGHGWLTIVPVVDRELDGLTGAVRALGPSLERQVWEWIETDRRCNAALVLARLRGRTAHPFAEAKAALITLAHYGPGGDQIRDLRRALDDLEHAISDEAMIHEVSPVVDDRSMPRSHRGSGENET